MGDEVALGEYEKLLLATKTTARKELVLLHPERYVASGFTRRWLKVCTVLMQPLDVDPA
jgi:lysophospholipid hydrolase